LRQLCLDLVAQRAAAGDWAATVAEENKTLAQLCGQVVLRDQPFVRLFSLFRLVVIFVDQ
jgi:hypothetical protein